MKIKDYTNKLIVVLLLLVLVLQVYWFFDIGALKEKVFQGHKGNFGLAWELASNNQRKICENRSLIAYLGTLDKCARFDRLGAIQEAKGNEKNAQSFYEEADACRERATKNLEQEKAVCWK